MLRINVLASDKCSECDHIIWTQTDNKPNKSRPNLACQCYCGSTFIKNNKTQYGGGAKFTKKELTKLVKEANSTEDGFEVMVSINGGS